MDIKEAAALLDGSEYREEGSRELFARLKDARLVAVFGASDDLTELRGAVDDEQGTDTILFDRDGMLVNRCDEDHCPYWRERKALAEGKVKPIWDEGEVDGVRWSWRYETAIPHATFRVMEDGEPYCLGIVFSFDDLGSK